MKPPMHSAVLSGLVPAPVHRDGRRGFTLLEMLLAVTIFAILGVIILSTFRTGMKAYEDAERQANLVDQARFVFDQLNRDIHSSVILGEDEYNKTINQKMQQLQPLYDEAMQTGNWDRYNQAMGHDPDDPYGDDKNQAAAGAVIGDPFSDNVPIDLLFAGEPSGDGAKLTFAIRKPIQAGRPYDEWGLTRVTYESKEGVLIRRTEPIQAPEASIFGELLEEPPAPHQEIMAEGVTRFSLRFGYWFDEIWLESDKWNSGDKIFRNSFYALTEDPDPEKEDARNQPGTPEYEKYNQLMNQAAYDKAPAYVRIRIEMADVKNPKRTETFSTILKLPQSVETYVPNTTIDDERMDAETDARIRLSEESLDESYGGDN